MLKAINQRIVVRRVKPRMTTQSGILIIDSDGTRPNVAEVISVADDVSNVLVGDRVLFDRATGIELKVEEETHFVLHLNNVFGVVRDGKVVALKNSILFQFLDETGGSKGAFSERYQGKIALVTSRADQAKDRWGKVLAVGPDVYGISPGEFVLVASQQWTRAETLNDQKIWKTVDLDTAVLAVTDKESETLSF